MLQIYSTQPMERIEAGLRHAAGRRGGHILAVSRFDQFMPANAAAFTMCFSEPYALLLAADVRFAAFLPCRIAVIPKGTGFLLETIAPGEYVRLLNRPDLQGMAAALDGVLRAVMEEAAHRAGAVVEHAATEDQVNMRAALPQRVDCRGTKVEELAGTGAIDAQGG
jgi:hypothetical protein